MATKPPDFRMPDGEYGGDVTCRDAWAALEGSDDAILVDVRTQVEWDLIGRPDLSSLDAEPVYLQWVTMNWPNPDFVDQLKAAQEARDAKPDTGLFYKCQSGGRSKIAAIQCTGLGYRRAFNIAEGFEGELDEHQHRNSISGWKVAGLPWRQK